MVLNLEQLKDVAAELPTSERAELAQFLFQTLDPKEAASIRSEWVTLAEQRMAKVKSGKVIGIPAEEVLKKFARPDL
jgi:putative addiction module component (TIGR02574 family)